MAKHWLSPPNIVAPSPDDQSKRILLGISQEFVDRNAAVFRRTPVYQIWTHLVGELPPINNVSRLMDGDLPPTITTLNESVACFRGVNRPYDDEENGDSVLVYVLNPSVTVAYLGDLACMARAVKVPANTALTVQVRLRKSLQTAGDNIHGTVTRLEFVAGSGGQIILPAEHSERYAKLLWSKP